MLSATTLLFVFIFAPPAAAYHYHQRGYVRAPDGTTSIDGVKAYITPGVVDVSATPNDCVLFDVVIASPGIQMEAGTAKCGSNTYLDPEQCGVSGNQISYAESYTTANGYHCATYGAIIHGTTYTVAARQDDGTNDLIGVWDSGGSAGPETVLRVSGFDTNDGTGFVWGEYTGNNNSNDSCSAGYTGDSSLTNIRRYQAAPGGGTWYDLNNATQHTLNVVGNSTDTTTTCYFNIHPPYSQVQVYINH
jgi:hypothetical protein